MEIQFVFIETGIYLEVVMFVAVYIYIIVGSCVFLLVIIALLVGCVLKHR